MSKKCEIKSGDVFGKLTVICEVEKWVYPSGDTRRQFLMQCSCGSPPKKMLISNFKTGSTVSCGCYNLEKSTSHGMHNTRQYQCWADMKSRCDNPDHHSYADYGGRGISYDEKWKTFEGFWEDMKEGYSDDLTINRRNNDGNYNKENCSWDTRHFQGHMRRKKNGTILKVIGGVFDERNGTMSACIKRNEQRIHLGNYLTEEEIAEAYDQASEYIYGDRPNKTTSTRKEIVEKVNKYLNNSGKNYKYIGTENANSCLNKEQVVEICNLLDSGFLQKDIAEAFGVSQSTISGICCGRIYQKESGRIRKYRN